MNKANVNPAAMLPHRKPMLMVDEVLARDDHSLTASATIAADNPLLEQGQFPGHAALELVAQAAGLFLGLRFAGEARPGAIVSVRDMAVHVASLAPGEALKIEVAFLGGSERAAMFEGRVIRGESSVLTATLTVSQFPEGVMP